MRARLLPLAAILLSVSAIAQTPPIAKVDPKSPANAGRAQLTEYLDGIASQELAARREAVSHITTRAQAEARQSRVRAQILKLIGGLPEKTPLNARVVGSTQLDGFRMEKVLFDSQPNFPVTALFYLPEHATGKLPAIVMAPGHGPTGKAGDVAMASTFARNGFAVLSYDPIGQGERLQYPDPAHPGQSLATRPTGEHGEAGLQPTLIGDALARYFAWDGIRAVDYVLSRPEVDPARIGAFGCSGGGAMTALLGALDPRVAAIGTACYITSFDTLLPSIGPQDSEQSTPGFIAAGLDFPDWVELAAPRPYAVIATVSDMFPWAGAKASAAESRRFYALFDPSSAGTPTGNPEPPTPTGPTLNPDTPNNIPPTAPLQFITGIGGHGNLRPLTGDIVSFFLLHLAHSGAAPVLPPPPTPGVSPFALPAGISKEALQVTPTGQVVTSYPTAETVFSLNLKRADHLEKAPRLTLAQAQSAVRQVTQATAMPGAMSSELLGALSSTESGYTQQTGRLHAGGYEGEVSLAIPDSPGRHPAVLLLLSTPSEASGTREVERLAKAGNVVLAFTPRPSPPGTEETKSPILGPFYLSELRAELVGKTLLGLRVDDTVAAIDFLVHRPEVDSAHITAQASGHMGLVLLHAAVLDRRLQHILVDHTLASYSSLVRAPLPKGAPEDILPGVLKHYDLPELVDVLGSRATVKDPLAGTEDLSVGEKP